VYNLLKGLINRYNSLHVKPSDFVVEIGSGNAPYWRSNLLIDKYVADSTERPAGIAPLVVDRPLVIADGSQLPLADRAVDCLIARNILEHIIDIEEFIDEMTRVAHSGYISTPSALAEKLFGWTKHVWFVSVKGEKLLFVAKQRPLYDPQLSSVFHSLFSNNRLFQQFYRRNRDLFTVSFRWEDNLNYEIRGATNNLREIKSSQAQFDLQNTMSVLNNAAYGKPNLRRGLENLLRRISSGMQIKSVDDLVNLLACPICHSSLKIRSPNALQCSGCSNEFPVCKGIPVLVNQAAGQT
jgi:uncharacterized protein YbaR (Trm112 family)